MAKVVIFSSLLSLSLIMLTLCAGKITSQTMLEIGAVCRTPDDVQGTCINVKQCPSMIILLHQKPLSEEAVEILRKSQCGFNDGQPQVCCPNAGAIKSVH